MNAPDESRQAADERFEQAARQLLRQGAGDIDAATASRLNRARQAALAEFDRRPARLPAYWRPAFAAAAVAVLAVALWVDREPLPRTAGAEAALELELMLADENLEMIEDLEFYDWLQADSAATDLDPELTG
ncbi:MAG: hypothetical protein IT486_05580 [Gammaproteobacteria bacterium]|nr:hypothetical protein [Gammaproteobacteria bacterium]